MVRNAHAITARGRAFVDFSFSILDYLDVYTGRAEENERLYADIMDQRLVMSGHSLYRCLCWSFGQNKITAQTLAESYPFGYDTGRRFRSAPIVQNNPRGYSHSPTNTNRVCKHEFSEERFFYGDLTTDVFLYA